MRYNPTFDHRVAIVTGMFLGLLVALTTAGHEFPRHPRLHTPEEVPALDAARLGMTEAELREAVGETLKQGRLSLNSQFATESSDPRQSWWYRELTTGDLLYAEYELFEGRVFRLRWRLAERFEGLVFQQLLDMARRRYGKPRHDQMMEARYSQSVVALRRIGWEKKQIALELRQLEPPGGGGPLFLSLTDRTLIRKLRGAGATAPLQPDRTRPWWSRKPLPEKLPSQAHIDELTWDFDALLAGSGF